MIGNYSTHNQLSEAARSKMEVLSYLRLPARLTAEQVAVLLGFQEHDISVLIKKGLLEPLGNPVANSPKYFAAVAIQQLAIDEKWLSKASKTISENWRIKNHQKRGNSTLAA